MSVVKFLKNSNKFQINFYGFHEMN